MNIVSSTCNIFLWKLFCFQCNQKLSHQLKIKLFVIFHFIKSNSCQVLLLCRFCFFFSWRNASEKLHLRLFVALSEFSQINMNFFLYPPLSLWILTLNHAQISNMNISTHGLDIYKPQLCISISSCKIKECPNTSKF